MDTARDTRPVLVAFDGSPPAEAALREAVMLFGHRPLIVVTVWEPGLAAIAGSALPGEAGLGYVPPDPATLAAVDQAEADHARDIASSGARIATGLGAADAQALPVPDEVDAAETIAAIAEERDAATIVVGSRGLGGLRARLLGSTSQKLLHRTHRPVLVVRAAD